MISVSLTAKFDTIDRTLNNGRDCRVLNTVFDESSIIDSCIKIVASLAFLVYHHNFVFGMLGIIKAVTSRGSSRPYFVKNFVWVALRTNSVQRDINRDDIYEWRRIPVLDDLFDVTQAEFRLSLIFCKVQSGNRYSNPANKIANDCNRN